MNNRRNKPVDEFISDELNYGLVELSLDKVKLPMAKFL